MKISGASTTSAWAGIAQSRLPVVSAVGHEDDVTLSDLVADLRAATPSAAAELVNPDQAEQQQQLKLLAQTLRRSGSRLILAHRHRLTLLLQRLRHALNVGCNNSNSIWMNCKGGFGRASSNCCCGRSASWSA